ncbi:hypothetical protein [Pseudoduganella namucuonensis]|uniref:Uncharacterized protein n=1 Tax=Pseudoduganella namucuonensis TaxID=1035707 RepID=A0A1I7M0I8_9BURK|nr:hypothetical protein [Pseudoduganella namucuonensis]SFV15472.1 hypothetical protein SAMN05216552_104623 [Pseudoduganella namucuonensis]
MTHDQRQQLAGLPAMPTLRGVEAMGFDLDDFPLPQCTSPWDDAAARRAAHQSCDLRAIGDVLAWVPHAEAHRFRNRVFYDGDYSDVREFDDPLVLQAIKHDPDGTRFLSARHSGLWESE